TLGGGGVVAVYRRFGRMSSLVRYALMAESQRVGVIMAEAVHRSAGPVSALAEMFAAFVSEARSPRLLTRSLRVSPAAGELTGFLTGKSEEHTSELQSRENLVCRLLLEKKKTK